MKFGLSSNGSNPEPLAGVYGTVNASCRRALTQNRVFFSSASVTGRLCLMGLKYSFSIFMDASGYGRSRHLAGTGAGGKGSREGGSTASSRQDTIMYVVTVQTALVKGPLCTQVKIVQE